MKRSMMIGTLVLSLTATGTVAQGMPFGSEEDVDFAAQIWTYLEESKLAGPGMIRATPY